MLASELCPGIVWASATCQSKSISGIIPRILKHEQQSFRAWKCPLSLSNLLEFLRVTSLHQKGKSCDMHQSHRKLACTLKVLRDTENSCILLSLREFFSLGAEIPSKFLDGSLATRFQGVNISPFSMQIDPGKTAKPTLVEKN